MLTIKIVTRCGKSHEFQYDPKRSDMEPCEALRFYEDKVKAQGYEIKEIFVIKPMDVNMQ